MCPKGKKSLVKPEVAIFVNFFAFCDSDLKVNVGVAFEDKMRIALVFLEEKHRELSELRQQDKSISSCMLLKLDEYDIEVEMFKSNLEEDIRKNDPNSLSGLDLKRLFIKIVLFANNSSKLGLALKKDMADNSRKKEKVDIYMNKIRGMLPPALRRMTETSKTHGPGSTNSYVFHNGGHDIFHTPAGILIRASKGQNRGCEKHLSN